MHSWLNKNIGWLDIQSLNVKVVISKEKRKEIMEIIELKKYWYPQKGIITIETNIGEFTKFKGFVEISKEGMIFYADGKKYFAKSI